MAYKVFLVEDEIATRKGIRDNVDWNSAGFELCGEAPDGEIAIPLIEAAQPDVLITDIKMPFMDGLQLSKIIREHMAWMKIIIISGYDEFSYAQAAIKLGVTEYLLKPVRAHDLIIVLNKVATQLDQEKNDRAYLKKLHSQVQDNLILLREKFLLRLVLGGESSLSAVEQTQQLGLNLLSPYYQIVLIKLLSVDQTIPLDYKYCEQVEKRIISLVSTNMEAFLTKKDLDEFILILKGESQEQLEQEGPFIAEMIQREFSDNSKYNTSVSVGSPQQRLGDLHLSFSEALVKLPVNDTGQKNTHITKIDQTRLADYLENGRLEQFDIFFEQTIQPLGMAALKSNGMKHYLMLDIILTTAQFVSDLGGNSDMILPKIYLDDSFLTQIVTMEQIKNEIQRIIIAALNFRNIQMVNSHPAVIQMAKNYISNHFSSPDLSLNEVAVQVNFSPNHFSAVFSTETGETFKDYLTSTRMEHAKKLLRTTSLKCAEVAFQCGYNDSHYFSIIFRKYSGETPQQFRASSKKNKTGA